MAPNSKHRDGQLPSREDIIEHLRERGEKAGMSELARTFGVKGKARTALRLLLRELEDQGLIDRPSRGKYEARQRLGKVAVLEITGPDGDGELRARPVRWSEGRPSPDIYVAPERGRGSALGSGERILARLTHNEDGSYDALPLRRLGSAPREVIGVYRDDSGQGRIQPTDRRAKYDLAVAPSRSSGAQPGDLVRVRVLTSRRRGLREAEVLERIGSMDSPGAIGMVALHSNGIPISFPDAVKAEAQGATPADLDGRMDLRSVPLVTIDGEDARDFDDAVFAEPDDKSENAGGWKILVAIADVGWYVRTGTALDEEARKRGNSVYLPDRVVPMLPEALSSGLCSLKAAEDRAVLVTEMRIDAAGNITRHNFFRGLMRSAARLTYEDVQGIRDGASEPPPGISADIIANLFGAYEALSRARVARGTLELDLPEYRISFTGNQVAAITKRTRLTSHRLIEDFMIAANVAAAETLVRLRAPCMYRVHAPPDPVKLDGLRAFLATFGIHLPAGQVVRAAQLSSVLERAARSATPEMIHEAILRCQSQAAYSPENLGHFGLALKRYAHFTSPIRRYSDLLVHRSLISALELGPGGLLPEDGNAFTDIGKHISETERSAQAAEREAVDRYVALYLAKKVGARFSGRIAAVTRFGLFVRLDEFGADGLVPASLLGPERWRHDERRHSLEGISSGTTYTLGDGVEVEVKEAEPVTGGLVFAITGHHPIARKTARRERPDKRKRARKPARGGRRR